MDQNLSLVQENTTVILNRGINQITFSPVSNGIIEKSIHFELTGCQFLEKRFLSPLLLDLKVKSQIEGQKNLKLTYLTRGINWDVHYQLERDIEKDHLNITAWLSVENKNKAGWENANLSFTQERSFSAQMETIEALPENKKSSVSAKVSPQSNISVKKQEDSILYCLQEPVVLEKEQKKTFFLFSFSHIPVNEMYVFDGEKYGDEVRELLCFTNPEQESSNFFFPEGKGYIYEREPGGRNFYVGTQQIPQLAPGQQTNIYLGLARGINAQRVQTFYREVKLSPVEKQVYNKDVAREYGYHLVFTNLRSSSVQVRVIERFYGEWKILESDPPDYLEKHNRIIYMLEIPPKTQKIIDYKARII